MTNIGVHSPPGSLFAGSQYDPQGQYNVPAGQANPHAAAIDALLANPWANFANYEAAVAAFEALGVNPDAAIPASGHPAIPTQKLRDFGFPSVSATRPGCTPSRLILYFRSASPACSMRRVG
jgi:hypothetical protein